jgi:protein-S-isoprenylcysteine O-methyltransferase Ste14
MLAASEFEFRQRFWIIGAIFFLAFLTYNLDHQNAGAAVTEWIARIRGTAATSTDYHLTFAVAALFAIAAALVRTWSTAYLNSEVMIAMRVQTSRLVADGPYRYVRNPLYFGNILLAVGFGLMASRVGFFILVVGMVAFCYRLILREEAGIAASQGDGYRAYCAAVPRLLPALRPKLPSAGGVPDWADGMLGEAFMWAMAASVIAFAITLNQTIYFVVLASSFLVCAVCLAVIKRRRKPAAADTEENSAEHSAKHGG